MGKLTISMAIFNSKLFVYQRVALFNSNMMVFLKQSQHGFKPITSCMFNQYLLFKYHVGLITISNHCKGSIVRVKLGYITNNNLTVV
jgi:hypothetical protein